ncbi:hypothetical protein ACLK10_16060 [Escherichia coli]
MIPITWPEFAELHPFCPPEQAEGYQQMIAQLADWLVKLRLRRRLYAAELRRTGRIRGPAGDSSLS